MMLNENVYFEIENKTANKTGYCFHQWQIPLHQHAISAFIFILKLVTFTCEFFPILPLLVVVSFQKHRALTEFHWRQLTLYTHIYYKYKVYHYKTPWAKSVRNFSIGKFKLIVVVATAAVVVVVVTVITVVVAETSSTDSSNMSSVLEIVLE